MNLFTIEVAGKAVLVFPEADRSTAETLAQEEIGPDLMEFAVAGEPLWDGETPLAVRAANPAETAQWTESLADVSRLDGGAEPPDPDSYAVFLIDVDDEEET
jgi:hypothetical protein